MTTDPPSTDEHGSTRSPLVCPGCGAYVKSDASRCWFCEQEPLSADRIARISSPCQAAPAAAAKLPPGPGAPLQFSLETLLLLTTLVAVCLGATVAAPPLGLLVSFVALGGLVRTLVIGQQHHRLGVPFALGDKIAEYIVSCGVVIGAMGVGAITLLGTCCLGGAAASSLDQVARSGSPGSIVEALSTLFAMTYVLLALLSPLFTTAWFLWATRPR